jgi:Regulator of chromosome condensation (RCC1) repeat
MTKRERIGACVVAGSMAAVVAAGAWADGTVVCWGYNGQGQCNVPADLGSVKGLGRGSANYYNTWVIRSGMDVRGWGLQDCHIANLPKNAGFIRKLAVSNYWLSYAREDLSGGNACGYGPASQSLVDVAANYNFVVSCLADGAVQMNGCCTAPSDATPARAVAAGEYFAMSLRTDGSVVCWGNNGYGQCNAPADLGTVSKIAAGRYHSMALRVDGTVACWGYNDYGQCNVPTKLGAVVDIAGGYYHSVALQQDGTVRCWGYNGSGQCSVPANLGPVTAISAGTEHTIALTCGLKVDNHLSPNLGQFGFGEGKQHTFAGLPTTSAAPVTVTVWARGDLDLASEFLTISVDGTVVGAAFNNVGDASDCDGGGNGLYRAAFTLTEAQYAAFAADGSITLRAEPSIGVSPTQCGNAALYLQLDTTRPYADCNGNGRNDACDIDLNPLLDCDQNGVPDSCEGTGGGTDCNGNQISDSCEIVANPVIDCDSNGEIDSCEIAANPALDCNTNGRIDSCDVVGEFGVFDCDNDNLIDTCEIAANPGLDCNLNGRLDSCDIATGTQDKDFDGRPDSCEFAKGDFNLDGQINGADLAGLLAIWGLANPPYGDFNGDNYIAGADLSILLSRWGPVVY